MKLPTLTQLSGREKKILYVVIALLVVLVGYHGIWTPMTHKFSELDDEIFATQMRFRKAKTLIRQKNDVVEASKKYVNLEKMDAGTDEEEIAKLLNFVEQTARKDSTSLSDVKPQPVKSDKVTKEYAVELNAEGELTSLIEFIYELEHSEQLLKIEKVDIAPKEEKSALLRASLTVTRIVVK